MSESVVPVELLQPYLFDRLTHPSSIGAVNVTARSIEEAVGRDLLWLLQTRSVLSRKHPVLEKSVLNYGMTELSGTIMRSMTIPKIRACIRDAIEKFEPRVIMSTLKIEEVRGNVGAAEVTNLTPTQIELRISADVWALPEKKHVQLRTLVDLQSGQIQPGEPQNG